MPIQLAVSIILSIVQPWSGIMFVSIYGPFITHGLTTNGEFVKMTPMLINFCVVPAAIISYFLFQGVGRRIIMLVGLLIAGVANMLIALGFFIIDQSLAGSILMFIGVFLFAINFGLTTGPVVWLYIP